MDIGSIYSEKAEFSQSDVEAFAELTCDFNPIHLDPDYAKSTIFGKPICHGSLVSSKFSKILATDLPGPGTILISQEIKFQKPIYWGEEIDIVVEVIGDLGANKFKLQTQAINQEGSIAVDGHAIVKRL